MNDGADKVLQSIENLPAQCLQAWQESGELITGEREDIANVIFCGMGASGLSGQIIQSLNACSKPFVVNSDFQLPAWAGQKSLVILSSYSGNTQEILNCAGQAFEKKCAIAGLTTGGKLAEFLKEHRLPSYIYNPTHNPSGLPRYGLAYGLCSGLRMLSNFHILEGNNWEEAIKEFQIFQKNSAFSQTGEDQASCLKGKVVIILAAEHLTGNARVLANQINESAKQLAVSISLPEGFHHFFESLNHPDAKVEILLFESDNYHADTKRRIALIKNKINLSSGISGGGDRFNEVLANLAISGYVSYYLARENGENPASTPWVDSFKQELDQ